MEGGLGAADDLESRSQGRSWHWFCCSFAEPVGIRFLHVVVSDLRHGLRESRQEVRTAEQVMTEMVELQRRKVPLNLAIVHTNPEAFVANLMGWLEITAFVTAQRADEAQVLPSGETPKLSPQQLQKSGVHDVGNDAVFAFCMTAAMKADKAAVDKVEADLVESMGKEFPGSVGLWHFRAQIDAPVTLEDFVGQAGKKMLLSDIPPPPLRAKENWNTGADRGGRHRRPRWHGSRVHHMEGRRQEHATG